MKPDERTILKNKVAALLLAARESKQTWDTHLKLGQAARDISDNIDNNGKDSDEGNVDSDPACSI